MLKHLRMRITLLAVLLTGAILAGALTLAFYIASVQHQNSCQLAFDSSVDEVIYQWSRFDILETSRLAQLQAESGIQFYFEENGQPLLYSRRSGEAALFAAVKEKASQQLLNGSAPPIAGLSAQRTDFFLDANGQHYRSTARLSRLPGGRWILLLAAQSTAPEEKDRTKLAGFFALLAFGTLVILWLVCWFVAGRAMTPIRNTMERQQQFLSAAGHELRTPLAVIRANVGAAVHHPEKTAQYLHTVDEESARMGSLVDELLLLSAGASAQQRLAPAALEPDTFLLDFMEGMEPLALQKGRALAIELPNTALPQVWADSHRLRQLLTILVDNALRYAPAGTPVRLRLDRRRAWVRFWVIDQGPGIPHREQKRIFQRFAQLQTAPQAEPHYGLGLSVAAELAALHKGRLWVQDTPGGGASFCLALRTGASFTPALPNEALRPAR